MAFLFRENRMHGTGGRIMFMFYQSG